ncbi:MAG: DUF3040 domain-containing protein [Actinobacteria bacterium]|nr:DUF3040 domain-containing protein [Actinomycetota bacterium]
MPLSEREKRILDDIEKQLYAEDPGFARSVRRRAPRLDEIHRVKLGASVLLIGFVVLIAFFVTGSLLAGVAAFAGMVAGIVLIAGSLRDLSAGRRSEASGRKQRLGALLEEWERRVKQRYKRL